MTFVTAKELPGRTSQSLRAATSAKPVAVARAGKPVGCDPRCERDGSGCACDPPCAPLRRELDEPVADVATGRAVSLVEAIRSRGWTSGSPLGTKGIWPVSPRRRAPASSLPCGDPRGTVASGLGLRCLKDVHEPDVHRLLLGSDRMLLTAKSDAVTVLCVVDRPRPCPDEPPRQVIATLSKCCSPPLSRSHPRAACRIGSGPFAGWQGLEFEYRAAYGLVTNSSARASRAGKPSGISWPRPGTTSSRQVKPA